MSLPGKTEPPLTEADKVKALHILYCMESGNQMRLTLPIVDDWHRWMANGWTADDLRITIKYLKKVFGQGNKPEVLRGMLHFRRLIRPEYVEGGHLDYSYFEQYLCDAQAAQRNARPAPTARSAALEAVGRRDDPPEHQARPVGQIAQDVLKACAEARKLIDES